PPLRSRLLLPFFCTYAATTELYTLSLHDALPISLASFASRRSVSLKRATRSDLDAPISSLLSPCFASLLPRCAVKGARTPRNRRDRKSTRLNSSHRTISYAVFCLKKKKINKNHLT